MQAINEIEKLIRGKSEDDVFGNMVYCFMTNLNQPLSEILNMPIPLAMELLRIINNQNKKMERESKKGGRR